MKVSANDLLEMGILDKIIKEPLGGAHRNFDGAAQILKKTILQELENLRNIPSEELVNKRIEKFGKMGVWKE